MSGKLVRKKGRGTLHVVAALLFASAALRVGTEAGPAIAQVAEQASTEAALPTELIVDEGSFLAALQEREARLITREAQLQSRLDAMAAAEVELDMKLAQLVAAEEALSATIAMAETASATDVAQLTTVYENMKPKEAAALFEEMSPEFAAGFLGLMRPDVAALIMTELEPETAYSFSVVLAGRNANTPTR